MWVVAAVAGLLSVVTGWLPLSEAHDVLTRVAPILVFLLAVTLLAELAEDAEVFDVAAFGVARVARGSVRRLYLLVAALAAVCTILLSLDTTAVLLTPVVLSLAARLRLNPLPFAMLTVYLANTASLLLPISNLTNLLALDRLHVSAAQFAGHMALAAVLAIVTTVVALSLWFRRQLRGSYQPPLRPEPQDRVLFSAAAAACLLLGPLLVLGAPAWLAAVVLAVALSVVFVLRRPRILHPKLLPWRLVVLTTGLFLTVAAAGRHGLDDLVHHLLDGGGQGRVAGVAAGAANAVNNLPAYLALERSTGGTDLYALLVGVNVGPLLLLWGSLATLLWHERCRARGVDVPWWRFASVGVTVVPFVLAASVLGLNS